MTVLLESTDVEKKFILGHSHFSKIKKHITALRKLSVKVNEGKSIGIVGESGSGKTTLAKILAGIIKPDSGFVYYKNKITFDKEVYKFYRKNVQMIFQDPYASFSPRLKIYSSLKDGIKKHITKNQSKIKDICINLLKVVSLDEQSLRKYPHEFSGGQLQRLSLVRALSLNPEIIIADEPVSALDVSIQAQILNLLKGLKDKDGTSFILIAHDLAIVRYLCDEVYVLYKGLLLEYGVSTEIFENAKHPYTKFLIEASKKKILEVKNFNNVGICPFSNRCPYFNNNCKNEIELVKINDFHYVRCTLFY